MKRTLRHALYALVLFLSWSPGLAFAQSADRIRIACVGDSITEGNANPDHLTNSWPMILGRLLEGKAPGRYECRNFGRSGATLLREGRKPYWDQDVYEECLAFQPDVVIINLGTNDAVDANWLEHGEAFEADYRDLIRTYQDLPSQPVVMLSNLTRHFTWHARADELDRNKPAVESIIEQLAAEFDLALIDLRGATANEPKLFPDALHPNTAGNELMAKAAFEALLGEPAPEDPSLRWRGVGGAAHPLVQGGQEEDVTLGDWTQAPEFVEGQGPKNRLVARVALGAGDFHMRARLRMLGQQGSAAAFVLGPNTFGFEGARDTVFRAGPQMLGLRLLHPADHLWDRGAWIEFEMVRNGDTVWFVVDGFTVEMATIPGEIPFIAFDPMRSKMQIAEWSVIGNVRVRRQPWMDARTLDLPWTDLAVQPNLSIADPPGDWEPQAPRVQRSPDGAHAFAVSSDSAGRAALDTFEVDGEPSPGSIELPAVLTGAGHHALLLSDGRLLVTYLDALKGSPTRWDWVAWVGTYDDLVNQREGEFTTRLWDLEDDVRLYLGSTLARTSAGEIVSTVRLSGTPRMGQHVQREIRFPESLLNELVPTRSFDLPFVDLDADADRHVIVDREPDQYLGHVTTELLDDGETILAVYPKGHGRGPIVYKRSTDGGKTWSDRLPTPKNWATSREVPTIHRVIDPATGEKRLILWSGLYPARLAHSEDDGATWSPLEPAGDWGGIVVMGFVERLNDGRYLAMFHDDGRFIGERSLHQTPPVFTLYQTFSSDGGLHWSDPEAIWSGSDIHLCEPGVLRSPDGKTLAVPLRENSRTRNSYVIFSNDEGATWSPPRELPASLTGDRHTLAYAPDGRVFACFRDMAHDSPTKGDWVGWVGTWEDLYHGKPGQYRIRFKDNTNRWDSTYPGVEVLADGTFVVTTYGHWTEGEAPYILSVRFTLEELDARAANLRREEK